MPRHLLNKYNSRLSFHGVRLSLRVRALTPRRFEWITSSATLGKDSESWSYALKIRITHQLNLFSLKLCEEKCIYNEIHAIKSP